VGKLCTPTPICRRDQAGMPHAAEVCNLENRLKNELEGDDKKIGFSKMSNSIKDFKRQYIGSYRKI